MTKKNPFEKHWKFLRELTRETWTHFEDIDSFETDFKKELEKQAKVNERIHSREKGHTCSDYPCACIGSAVAFRLVQGKGLK